MIVISSGVNVLDVLVGVTVFVGETIVMNVEP
jgi:hypothetical protein